MDNSVRWLHAVPPCLVSPRQKPVAGPGILILQTPLHAQVLHIKDEIDRVAPQGQWDDAKKITNTYEYIFLSLQRRMHRSIASIQPLSRSYFKMIEMWDVLDLSATRTAHSAEGPGGFLEAIQDRSSKKIPMTAMTLKSTERTVPGWRKSNAFLQTHPQIHITYGFDGTGNLYNLANQDAFAAQASPADIYTADGGFDFSADFNGQENTVQRLLIAEALAGIMTLREGGTMILKLFDTKNRATLELMWMLASCFERTGLIKPYTSRPANSERYWIGSGYRGAPEWIITFLRSLTATEAPYGWNHLFEDAPWFAQDLYWLTDIQLFQEELEAQQFMKIQLTLNLIKYTTREQITALLLENIRNSRAWCLRHRIPQNPAYTGLTDEQIVQQNLEEALVPFQASVARTNLLALSRLPLMHRELTTDRSPRPPVAPAWRTALPASVLGREPSQTCGGTAASRQTTPTQSPPASGHVPGHP